MKSTKVLFFTLFITAMATMPQSALSQETSESTPESPAPKITESNSHFLMFLHGGYGYMPNREGKGLTNASSEYTKKMASGASWNAQLFFQHKMFIVGMMYSGLASNGKIEVPSVADSQTAFQNSDKILTTYIAPQLGMNIPVSEKFAIGWNGGLGGMIYRNNSIVYENPRVVKGSNIGLNLGVRAIYSFTKNLGLSAEVMFIGAKLHKSNINYHQEDIEMVYVPALPVNQCTFSIGLKYSL
jgi:hypothetical protein